MKNYLLSLILFLILPVISCEAKSSIVFEETLFDFGKVSKESSLRHTFNFKNTGTGTLVIDRIKAG